MARRARLRCYGSLAALLGSLFRLPSSAASDVADEADFLFRRGTQAYQRGDYEGALERFLASNRLVENQNVMFNIAHTYERLGRYPEAHYYFSVALPLEKDPTQVARIRQAIASLEKKIAVLVVETTPPGATVYLERKDLGARGSTPHAFGLGPGARVLLLELPGFHSERIPIPHIGAGEERRVNVKLRPVLGRVQIDAPEGTVVKAPGVPGAPGCAAPCELALPPGEVRLNFERPGFRPQELSVTVVESRLVRVSPRLLPEQGRLVVRSDEPGAQIESDGAILGFTPAVLALPVGTHSVEVSRRGFRPERREVLIEAKRTTVLSLVLNRDEEVTAASRVRERLSEAPGTVSVVPDFELESFRYPTLVEALRGMPGVYVRDDRSYASLDFRGVSRLGNYGNRVLVLVDGHPLNDNWLGSSYVGYEGRTDLRSVERIEVARGPGSVVYGTSAFSGVINLVSRPVARKPETRLGVGTAGDGVAHAWVRSDAPFGKNGERGGIWTQASLARGRGRDFHFEELREAAPEAARGDARGVDGFDAATVDGKLGYDAFSARWFWHSHDKSIPTAQYDTLVGSHASHQRDTRFALELHAEPRLSRTISSLTRLHLNQYRFFGTYPRAPEDRGLEVDVFRGSWVGIEQRFEVAPSERVRVLVGGEFQSHFQVEQWASDESGVVLDEKHPFRVGAGYASLNLTPVPALTLDLGSRLDVYSTFGRSLNPRASLIARPYRGGTFKLLGATAFRAPSVYELYYNDGGRTQKSNPGLAVERIYSVEAGFSHELTPLITASATLFGNYVRNLVTSRGSGNAQDPLQYVNSDVPLASVGAELSLRRDFRNGVFFSASYAVIDARFLSEESAHAVLSLERNPDYRNVENVPGHVASFKAVFPFYARALRFASRLTLETGRYDRYELNHATAEGIPSEDTQVPPPQLKTSPVALLDFVLSGASEVGRGVGFAWAFGLYNVFDYDYSLPVSAEFRQRVIPQAGRTLLLSLELKL